MMSCPQCGRQVLANSKFCDGCGAMLTPMVGSSAAPPMVVCPSCQQLVSSEGYCENCGAVLAPVHGQPAPVPMPPTPMPVLSATRLMLQPANIIFPFPAGKQTVLIGREDPNRNLVPEINLEAYGGAEAGVSRQHARVYYDGAQWLLEHLSQTNRTLVNDLSIYAGQPCALKNGDVVCVGRLTLIFRV